MPRNLIPDLILLGSTGVKPFLDKTWYDEFRVAYRPFKADLLEQPKT